MYDLAGATLWARKTLESDIFFWKPDKWFKIWFCLVTLCNHKDNKQFKRGEVLITYQQISNITKANKNQIDHCMRFLKESGMCTTRKTTRGMYVSLLNYHHYQTINSYKSDTKSELEAKSKRNESDTINKYDNNDKNDKYNTSPKFETIDLELSMQLQDAIKKNLPTFKEPNLESWAEDVNKMRRLDNRTPEQIKYLINWAQSDSFWQGNILSAGKLREKFDTLVAQAKRNHQKQQSKGLKIGTIST